MVEVYGQTHYDCHFFRFERYRWLKVVRLLFVLSFFRPNETLHNYAATFVKVQCCMIILYGMCYVVIMVIVFEV